MTEERKQTGYPSVDKPWSRYYSEDAIIAPLPESTLYEYLLENDRDYPKDTAILYLGRKISYSELFRQIDRTAAAFSALGVVPGEIVTVALPSIPEALFTIYALNKIGAVANMIHPLAGERELLNYLNEVQSRVAILFEGTYPMVKDSIGQTKVEHAVVVSAGESLPFGVRQLYFLKTPRAKLPKGSGLQDWPSFLAGGKGVKVPAVKKDCRELALISHTGGTTGEPKGVMLSDYNINALIWQLGVLPHRRGDRNLVVLPPFINYSLVDGMLGMLALGIQVVLIPDYRPEKIGEYIKKYRPNHISSIPPYWEALLEIKSIGKDDLKSLQHIYYGGEAMAVEKEQAVNRVLTEHGAKSVLHKGLGSTELVSAATMTYDACNTPGSAGIPLVKVELKIVEPDTTEERSYFQQGEICFSGPTLMLGYYDDRAATDAVVKIHADGKLWLHTGDIGYIDENGVVYVTGRIKRIMITKGKDGISTKLFPDRVEKVIGRHAAVECCCVIGVPDEERIHYPKAFVVPKDRTQGTGALTEDILRLCREQLPDYMVPEEIEFRAELPRTPRGKIDFRAMEEEERSRSTDR